MKSAPTCNFIFFTTSKLLTLPILLFLLSQPLYAQLAIGTSEPHSSAQLEVASDNKGVLIPRMNQQARNGISPLTEGLIIYQTDNTPGFYYYDGSSWTPVKDPKPPLTGFSASTANQLINSSSTGISGWAFDNLNNSFLSSGSSFIALKAGLYHVSTVTNFSHAAPSSTSISSSVAPRMTISVNGVASLYGNFPILDVNLTLLTLRTLLNRGTVPIDGIIQVEVGDIVTLSYEPTGYSSNMGVNVQFSAVKIN